MLTVSTLAAAARATGLGSALAVQDQASLRAAPPQGHPPAGRPGAEGRAVVRGRGVG